MVAAAEPAVAVGRLKQRLDLRGAQVGDDVALVALGRDRGHSGDRGGVLGVAQCREPVERVDRRKSRVAGSGAVAPLCFEVGEERADQWGVEVVEVQLERLLAGLLLGE